MLLCVATVSQVFEMQNTKLMFTHLEYVQISVGLL